MASVSSLDQDMRNLRLGRYTPQAANEVRTWVEETLGEQLPPGDLLEALKDGVTLCKLANLALPPPGIKFKKSGMPFIQMENISHFLKACEMPPLNMPAHDRFLTVDLFESKDPAQVLQCLGAFSRQAHTVNPARFRTTIGPAKKSGMISPTGTGAGWTNGGSLRSSIYGRPPSPTKPSPSNAMPSVARAMSPQFTGGSTGSNTSTPGPVSSWSSKKDESVTSPAWNIHQYGYMGGASQGNQGISFGARRQITSASPSVPNANDKLRKRKEKEEEELRQKQQAEEAERQRRVNRDAEEERERMQEERNWENETRRKREEERDRVEKQKRQWEEQDRRWKEEEEARRKEDIEMQKHLMPKRPPEKPRVSSSSILRGQGLAQYQKEQAALSNGNDGAEETPEQARVKELEKQLEEARERERQYHAEREDRLRQESDGSRPSTAHTEVPRPQSAQQSEASWTGDEREYLRSQWQTGARDAAPAKPAALPGARRPVPVSAPQQDTAPPRLPSRTVPQPAKIEPEPVPEEEEEETNDLPSPPPRTQQMPMQSSISASSMPRFNPGSAPTSSPLGSSNRPLPTPDKEFRAYSPEQLAKATPSRTSAFLSANTPPQQAPRPRVSSSQETGDATLEQQRDRDRRLAAQEKTKAGGWASKSLLEREMERERERQREWQANQQSVQEAAPASRDASQGAGQGQSWDVNQYGYTGGDNMNRGSSTGSGINFGGRRQILGPRPQK